MILQVVGNLFVVFGLAGLAYLAVATSGGAQPAREPGAIPERVPVLVGQVEAPAEQIAAVQAVEQTAGVQAVEQTSGVQAVEQTAGVQAVEQTAGVQAVEQTAGVQAVEQTSGVQAVEQTAAVQAVEQTAAVQANPSAVVARQITHLRIPRLRIDSEVVLSPFVQVNDSGTWEVPAFKVGHAEFTASAGQVGNAVLFGHVTSKSLGNVFQNLERARTGDLVEISSPAEEFVYQVVEVRRVPRTDVSVVEPTDRASASLITCVGLWLPHVNDYAERLVVRAELMG